MPHAPATTSAAARASNSSLREQLLVELDVRHGPRRLAEKVGKDGGEPLLLLGRERLQVSQHNGGLLRADDGAVLAELAIDAVVLELLDLAQHRDRLLGTQAARAVSLGDGDGHAHGVFHSGRSTVQALYRGTSRAAARRRSSLALCRRDAASRNSCSVSVVSVKPSPPAGISSISRATQSEASAACCQALQISTTLALMTAPPAATFATRRELG